MARLSQEAKVFIIGRLACYDTPDQVAKAVKEEFGIEISRQHAETHDPTKAAGKALGKRYRALFEQTRAEFLENVGDIPIANKAVRLRMLQRMAAKAEERGNMPLAASLLEQAAKEVGEAYTNKQRLEHTGKDGKPIETRAVSGYSDAELEARIKELEGKVGKREPRRA